MARRLAWVLLATSSIWVVAGFADARSRTPQSQNALPSIVGTSPTLAPFQHVRFCLRYPTDCESNASENEQVELSTETWELLNRVNRSVNVSIIPIVKGYGTNLQDGWTIAPDMGDCNDYAVTKRHELLASGLPSKALRLSVVKTASGVGHLVLVVTTTKGDIVMDNLTEAVRPWQSTDYHWLKIQSASDAKFWYDIKDTVAGTSLAQIDRHVHLADRQTP
jgi:predicted transglutaminase-like cysteine proteinase